MPFKRTSCSNSPTPWTPYDLDDEWTVKKLEGAIRTHLHTLGQTLRNEQAV